jgi:hypothetical protein
VPAELSEPGEREAVEVELAVREPLGIAGSAARPGADPCGSCEHAGPKTSALVVTPLEAAESARHGWCFATP